MLLRYDPFRELDRFARASESDRPPMPFDAYRNGDVVVLDIDLPGVEPDSVDLTVERNELRVEATRARENVEGRQYLVQERPMGRATRRLFLGENLDTDHLDAEYHQGVLTLRIPLRETAKPRKVEIRSSSPNAVLEA
jgi:HSP20 family protein